MAIVGVIALSHRVSCGKTQGLIPGPIIILASTFRRADDARVSDGSGSTEVIRELRLAVQEYVCTRDLAAFWTVTSSTPI